MTLNTKLTIAATTVAVLQNAKIARLEKKNKQLARQNLELKLVNLFLENQCEYLASMLDKHGITPDEFDKIALGNPHMNLKK